MDNILSSSHNTPCVLRKVNLEGWPAHELANGLVQVFVVPRIGGRARSEFFTPAIWTWSRSFAVERFTQSTPWEP